MRYLYVQHTVVEDDSVAPLQKFGKMKFGNFHLLDYLCALVTSKKRVDRDFRRVLEIWNKPILSQNTQQ